MLEPIFSEKIKEKNMATYELDDTAVTNIILALDEYIKILENDEEEPGPSMMDALYVRELVRDLRLEYNQKKETAKKVE